MPIIIKDETAGLVVLTIDNNGNMAFGNGTPINRLTLDGYGIIDNNGSVTHGVGSSNLKGTVGSASIGYVGSGTPSSIVISTLAGVTPTVQIDSDYPSDHVTIYNNADQHLYSNKPSVLISALRVGSFTAQNTNYGNANSSPPAVPDFSGNFGYRWL